ncbi:MAG: hypothetical protein ACFFFC_18010 [Candidatus Thorarchaeota archaeon]
MMFRNLKLKTVLGLSLMGLLILSQVSFAAAASNQGLEWGIDVNDCIDYYIEIDFHNSTLDFQMDDGMYLIIDDLPAINNDIVGLSQLCLPTMVLNHYSTYWENGTPMDFFWESYMNMEPVDILPVGNWTLMTQLLEDATPTADMTQDSSTLNFTVLNLPNPGNELTTVFSKTDGVPVYHLYNITWGMDTTIVVELERILASTTSSIPVTTSGSTTSGSISSPPPGDSTIPMTLGAVALAMVVILMLAFLRKR